MKVAGIWSGIQDGVPQLSPHLEKDGAEDASEIIDFLEKGTLVLRSAGCSEDWLDAERKEVVPIGFRTDGEWIWADELAYYIKAYGVMPPNEFVAYIRAQGYVPKEASPDKVQEASALLTN
jgi:hypothetical protein